MLDGKVGAYNAQGKTARTATFKNGALVSDAIKLRGDSYNRLDNYFLLTRTVTDFTIENTIRKV